MQNQINSIPVVPRHRVFSPRGYNVAVKAAAPHQAQSNATHLRRNGGPVLGTTRNGRQIIDRPNSHRHLPESLLAEALGRINLQATGFTRELVDFGRAVGLSTCVPTGSTDEIVYARRERRDGLTRFVKNRQASPCSTVVVILKETADRNTWVLITAFVGDLPEPEPWDAKATLRSWEFWGDHALVWGSEPIVPGTETTVCPWSNPAHGGGSGAPASGT